MAKEILELKQSAAAIRDELNEKQNTAFRVGQHLIEVLDKLEADYMSRIEIGEVNAERDAEVLQQFNAMRRMITTDYYTRQDINAQNQTRDNQVAAQFTAVMQQFEDYYTIRDIDAANAERDTQVNNSLDDLRNQNLALHNQNVQLLSLVNNLSATVNNLQKLVNDLIAGGGVTPEPETKITDALMLANGSYLKLANGNYLKLQTN